jgi:hypothetical protein
MTGLRWGLLVVAVLLVAVRSGAESVQLAVLSAPNAATYPSRAATIPVGTTITYANWQNFKEFMPYGMISLFEGNYFWKMPADVAMEIGQPLNYSLPASYLAATEKYSGQVTVVELPDGGLTLANYHGGVPFPNPQEPHRGWKVVANLWFRYFPRLIAQTYGYTCGMNALSATNCLALEYVTRQFAYNTDPGAPLDGAFKDIYYTSWFMLIEPEQQKYTTTLTVEYADLGRPEDSYVFVPALRRYQTLSASARCTETAGTDATHDDFQFGFDSNLTELNVEYLGKRRILTLANVSIPTEPFPAGFDLPLGWPKPSMGKWQLRDVDELAITKLPSSGAAKCYGRRIYYVDSTLYMPLWSENYDQQMKPVRYHAIFPHTIDVPGIGSVTGSGSDVEIFWNLANQHATFTVEPALDGKHYINQQVPARYDDIPRYSTPSGLNLIMR